MKYSMIGTWKMAFDGIIIGENILKNDGNVKTAIEESISHIEDNPSFNSVGFGSLPNIEGELELDAAFMDGNDLSFGAICSVKNIKNPIKVAHLLSERKRNCYLSSHGAEKFARLNKFEFKNMLNDIAIDRWNKEIKNNFDPDNLEAYDGHDTVCMIGLDSNKNMAVGVSTSGLFMKQSGRVGDSPVIGSGFYCDSLIGGAAATGVGEDIMKGCLSISIVNRMKMGEDVQTACENSIKDHIERFKNTNYTPGTMSVIALDKNGNFGAATNREEFPFVVASENFKTKILVCKNSNLKMEIFEPDEEWLKNYDYD